MSQVLTWPAGALLLSVLEHMIKQGVLETTGGPFAVDSEAVRTPELPNNSDGLAFLEQIFGIPGTSDVRLIRRLCLFLSSV